jgi:hypothetical protein
MFTMGGDNIVVSNASYSNPGFLPTSNNAAPFFDNFATENLTTFPTDAAAQSQASIFQTSALDSSQPADASVDPSATSSGDAVTSRDERPNSREENSVHQFLPNYDQQAPML